MKFQPNTTHLSILTIIILSIAFLSGLSSVPFHPDESTYIFMSADFELIFTNLSEVLWRPDRRDDLRQRYRELDAPLTRYLIGVGRLAAGGLTPLAADWDWTQSWQHNQRAGAYPDAGLLLAARIPSALLFPLTLMLLYLCVKSIASVPTAWLTMLLYAANALILLHTRRAMAEPILLFTIMLSMYSLLHPGRIAWWAAIPAALAFCAKHSAGIMILAVVAGILWQPSLPLRRRIVQAAIAVALFTGTVFFLNPFLWSNPIQAAQSALQSRAGLLERQVTELGRVNPEKVLTTPLTRLAAQVGQLYFTQPAVWDISNYVEEQHESEAAYLANPVHTLLRSPAGGISLMFLGLYGFAIASLNAIRQSSKRRMLILLILVNGLHIVALLWFVPLPFQRYSIPLVPFICIWSAIGLWKLIELGLMLGKRISRSGTNHGSL